MIINWKEIISSDSRNNFYNGGWVKQATGVDKSQGNGYCFEGDFVSRAINGLTECGDGLYIVCSVEGSRKNQEKRVAVYRVAGEQVERVIDWVYGNDWALQIRDQVAELLTKTTSSMVELSTEELALIEQLKALAPNRIEAVLAALK